MRQVERDTLYLFKLLVLIKPSRWDAWDLSRWQSESRYSNGFFSNLACLILSSVIFLAQQYEELEWHLLRSYPFGLIRVGPLPLLTGMWAI